MATVNFLLATDMTLGWAWDGYTEKATSNEILIWQGYGGDAIRYKGSGFRYDYYGDVVGGTLTAIDYAINVWSASSFSMQFKITGLNLYAPTVANLVDSGDYISILEYIAIGNDTFNGSTGNDNLWAFNGNDVIKGNAGNDLIFGMDGDDLLDGGSGADQMEGGDGYDTYIVDHLNDQIYEELQGGSDLVKISINTPNLNYVIPDNLENAALINKVSFNLEGNELNNNLLGNASSNTLNGLDGNNTLTGGAGIDTFLIDGGVDTVTDLGNGTDIIYVASGTLNANLAKAWTASNVSYNNGIASITANGLAVNLSNIYLGANGFTISNNGNNKSVNLTGSYLADTIIGGSGADTLNGKSGNDILTGGAGADTFLIDSGNDSITDFGYGQDNLSVTSGNTIEIDIYQSWIATSKTINNGNASLNSHGFNLNLSAVKSGNGFDLTNTSAQASFIGSQKNDVLNGGTGIDTLNGHLGNDTLVGNSGADIFVFNTKLNATTNVDTIEGFEQGTDIIHLDDAIFSKLKNINLSADNIYVVNDVRDVNGKNDFLVYNTSTGALSYDADGIGSKAPIQFATLLLGVGQDLSSSDFLII
jgi:Ca2+-binding RTX toxin-like protein